MIKACSVCEMKKTDTEFYSRKKSKSLYRSECKKCTNIKTNEYRKKNPESVRFTNRIQYETKKEELKEKSRLYRRKNPNTNNEYVKRRLKEDPGYRALFNVRNRTRKLLSGATKYSHSIGCSFEKFKTHIESQFKPGMNWDNYGKWQLDHIYPLSIAYKNGEDHFRRASHYTNLQPLWAEENLKKGNKVS